MESTINRHRTDSILLTENIKLDIIHEANPYFAGERISVVVRLEHLGSEEERSRLKARIDDLERRAESRSIANDDDDDDDGNDKSRDSTGVVNGRQGSSLVQSLFNAFLGEKRDDFEDEEATETLWEQPTYNDQLKRTLERQLKLHEPVDLLSGYLQVLGVFYFDSNIIDEEKINYKTSKLPGLARLITQHTNTQFLGSKSDQSEKVTTTNNNNDLNDDREAATHRMSERMVDTAKFYNSDFNREFPVSRPFPLSTDFPIMPYRNQTNIKCPPIFLIPQTLLFPEVKLCPGDVRTFHFKSKRLPLDMCPSYEGSEKVGVSYSLEFGANLIKEDAIQPLSSLIPITVAPYVSPRGYQYKAKLDGDVYVAPAGSIRDIPNAELSNGSQSSVSFPSLNAATGPRSRSSTMQSSISVSREKRKQLKQKFIELVQSLEYGTRHIEDLVDMELETQFGGLLDPPSSDENVSEQSHYSHVHKDTARVNLENLINMPISNLLNEETQGEGEEVEVEVEAEGEMEGEEANGEQDLGEKNPDRAKCARKRAVSIVAAGRLSPQLRNLQKSYIINKNGVQVAHVNFSRYFYTTSDDIQLTVDFKTGNFGEGSSSVVSGISATLELIEKLNPNFFVDEFSVSNDGQRIIPIAVSHATVFDRTDIVPITIMIPRTPHHRVASQFKTNIFDVRWAVSLRFVLINKNTEDNMIRFYEDKRGTLLHSKDTIEGEEFIGRIPVVIIPSPASF